MLENKPFIYNKFKYTEDGIEYPKDIKVPRHLYKYYPINSNSLNSFVNEYLFFSHPNQLNDILDCSIILLNPKSCTKELYEGICKHYAREFLLDNASFLDYETAKKNRFKELKINISFFKFFHRGILSLTTSPLNKLMMPHYTNERGFVLEFNTDKLLNFLEQKYLKENVTLFPMNYAKSLKPINYFKYVIDKLSINEDNYRVHTLNELIPFLYIASVKDKVWKYENEWRILLRKEEGMGFAKDPKCFSCIDSSLISTNERRINFNFDCLDKIILAPMFFNNYYFSEEKYELDNTKVSYRLNSANLRNEKMLTQYKNFLRKICSKSMNGKIILQDYKRICYKLDKVIFYKDVISFRAIEVCEFEFN